MKIAIDSSYNSWHIKDELSKRGHIVVLIAKEGERDNIWLSKAKQNKAELVISRDKEVVRYSRDHNMIAVVPTQGVSGEKLGRHIAHIVDQEIAKFKSRMGGLIYG